MLALLVVVMFVRQFMNPEHLDPQWLQLHGTCLLYTSDAADERSSVDLGGRRIIKKKRQKKKQKQIKKIKIIKASRNQNNGRSDNANKLTT